MKTVSTLLFIAIFLATGFGINAQKTAETARQTEEKKEESNYGRTPAEYYPFGKFTKPYKRFFLDPLEYRGYGRNLPEPANVESVKIGFLGPIAPTVSVATGGPSHEQNLGRKMLQGAELAIEQANEKGGYAGYRNGKIPYELVVRNDNGLWGASGNEIIHLAYKDDVRAILGTIDGANSHITIRVALKIEIPVMNTGDTDPTFTETAIPWVFRCISDDRQQGYLLVDYLYRKLGLKRVGIIRSSNRYGRFGVREIRDGSRRLGHPIILEMAYNLGIDDFSKIAEHKDELDGKIYGIEPGNDGNRLIQKMIDDDAFGLKGFEVVESSEQGMLAQVARSVKRKEAVVFLGWEPHPMNANFDMTYLSGGDDWFGPDYGGATVYTNVRKGYTSDCPNVGQLLSNLKFSLKMENEIMGAILDDGKEPNDAAAAWLKANPGVLDGWLAGVATIDGQDGLPAVKKHLGL